VALAADLEVTARIVEESEVHHDLIQGNFIDAYRNMTYKHVMGLKWATYFCQNARYTMYILLKQFHFICAKPIGIAPNLKNIHL